MKTEIPSIHALDSSNITPKALYRTAKTLAGAYAPNGKNPVSGPVLTAIQPNDTDVHGNLIADNLMCKRFDLQSDGTWSKSSFNSNALTHKAVTYGFKDIREFGQFLSAFQNLGKCALVVDSPRPGQDRNWIERNGASFVYYGQYLFCMDLDDIYLDSTEKFEEKERIAQIVEDHLQEQKLGWLLEASYIVQLSSSYGIPKNIGGKRRIKAGLHVWFCCEELFHRDAMKEYFLSAPWSFQKEVRDGKTLKAKRKKDGSVQTVLRSKALDTALFHTVQVHYTARPQFYDNLGHKAPDIMQSRVFLVEKASDTFSLPSEIPAYSEWLEVVAAKERKSKVEDLENKQKLVAELSSKKTLPVQQQADKMTGAELDAAILLVDQELQDLWEAIDSNVGGNLRKGVGVQFLEEQISAYESVPAGQGQGNRAALLRYTSRTAALVTRNILPEQDFVKAWIAAGCKARHMKGTPDEVEKSVRNIAESAVKRARTRGWGLPYSFYRLLKRAAGSKKHSSYDSIGGRFHRLSPWSDSKKIDMLCALETRYSRWSKSSPIQVDQILADFAKILFGQAAYPHIEKICFSPPKAIQMAKENEGAKQTQRKPPYNPGDVERALKKLGAFEYTTGYEFAYEPVFTVAELIFHHGLDLKDGKFLTSHGISQKQPGQEKREWERDRLKALVGAANAIFKQEKRSHASALQSEEARIKQLKNAWVNAPQYIGVAAQNGVLRDTKGRVVKFDLQYLRNMAGTKGLVLLARTSTGTGKTQTARALKDQVLAENPNANIQGFSPTIALANSLAGVLDIPSYTDEGIQFGSTIQSDTFTSPINSAPKHRFWELDYMDSVKIEQSKIPDFLLYDELWTIFHQTVYSPSAQKGRQVAGWTGQSGETDSYAWFQDTMSRIAATVQKGGLVVIADAHLPSFMNALLQKHNVPEDSIIEFDFQRNPGLTVELFTDQHVMEQEALELLGGGEKIALHTNSRKHAKRFTKQCEDLGRKVLCVHGKSSKKAKDELRNPNDNFLKYDAIVYTSAMGAGVSFDRKGCFHVFVHVKEHQVKGKKYTGCSDVDQASRRFRWPKDSKIRLFVKGNKKKPKTPVDLGMQLMEKRREISKATGMRVGLRWLQPDPSHLDTFIKTTEQRTQEAWNLRRTTMKMLKQQGYVFQVNNRFLGKAGEAYDLECKDISQRLQSIDHDNIIDAARITPAKSREMKKKRSELDVQDAGSLERYFLDLRHGTTFGATSSELRKQLSKSRNEIPGIRWVEGVRALQGDTQQAIEKDRAALLHKELTLKYEISRVKYSALCVSTLMDLLSDPGLAEFEQSKGKSMGEAIAEVAMWSHAFATDEKIRFECETPEPGTQMQALTHHPSNAWNYGGPLSFFEGYLKLHPRIAKELQQERENFFEKELGEGRWGIIKDNFLMELKRAIETAVEHKKRYAKVSQQDIESDLMFFVETDVYPALGLAHSSPFTKLKISDMDLMRWHPDEFVDWDRLSSSCATIAKGLAKKDKNKAYAKAKENIRALRARWFDAYCDLKPIPKLEAQSDSNTLCPNSSWQQLPNFYLPTHFEKRVVSKGGALGQTCWLNTTKLNGAKFAKEWFDRFVECHDTEEFSAVSKIKKPTGPSTLLQRLLEFFGIELEKSKKKSKRGFRICAHALRNFGFAQTLQLRKMTRQGLQRSLRNQRIEKEILELFTWKTGEKDRPEECSRDTHALAEVLKEAREEENYANILNKKTIQKAIFEQQDAIEATPFGGSRIGEPTPTEPGEIAVEPSERGENDLVLRC